MPSPRKKFVFAANNRNGFLCGRELLKNECIPEVLLFHPASRQKWGEEIKNLFPGTPVVEWRKNVVDDLKKTGAEVLLSVNFGYIFPSEVLSVFEYPINIHMGYLPFNRGSHPNVWSIVENTPAGVTMHIMTEEVDKGDVISRTEIEVAPDETGKSLYEKLETISAQMTGEFFPSILAQKFTAIPMPGGGTIHYAHEFKDLCRIDSEKPVKPEELIRLLRALSFPPYKNAYIELNGERLYIDASFAIG